ncbi:MAG: TolC family protein [Cytophagales bacterium]|nr:TolC family protein [Cytophagales bacterium]
MGYFLRTFLFFKIFSVFVLQAGVQDRSIPPDTLELRLSDCFEQALAYNFSVQKTVLNIREAKQNLNTSKLAFTPFLRGRSGLNQNWGRSVDPTSNLFVSRQNTAVSLNMNAGLNLGRGLQRLSEVKRARVQLQMAELDAESIRYNTVISVLSQYLDILLSESLWKNEIFKLENIQNNLNIFKERVKIGEITESDFLKILSQEGTGEVQVILRENEYKMGLLQLKQAYQIPLGQEIRLDPISLNLSLSEYTEYNLDSLYQVGKESHPRLERARMKLEEARIQLQISRHQFFPSFEITGGLRSNYSSVANRPRFGRGESVFTYPVLGYLTEDPSQTVTIPQEISPPIQLSPDFPIWDQLNQNLSYGVGASMSIPIYDQGTKTATLQRSRLNQQRALIEWKEEENRFRVEIERALQQLQLSQKLCRATERSLALSKLTFQEIEKKYLLGSATQNEYEISLNELFQARGEHLRSQYTLVFREKILQFYQNPRTIPTLSPP